MMQCLIRTLNIPNERQRVAEDPAPPPQKKKKKFAAILS